MGKIPDVAKRIGRIHTMAEAMGENPENGKPKNKQMRAMSGN